MFDHADLSSGWPVELADVGRLLGPRLLPLPQRCTDPSDDILHLSGLLLLAATGVDRTDLSAERPVELSIELEAPKNLACRVHAKRLDALLLCCGR